MAALTGRLSQSMVDEAEALLETYTDDPILAIAADEARTHRISAMMVMMWRAIGFDLACHKAQLSRCVTWIGYEIEDKGTRSWRVLRLSS